MTDITENRFKVSVAVITYNQEAYIAQTLDGIFAQQCNFDFEVVIGEDCSTDNTANICLSYYEKHPTKIRVLRQAENQGLAKNCYQTMGLCRGEYIARCDGDDYWCDPLKLQKQVDFLDHHPDYALVYGGKRMLKTKTGESLDCLPKKCADDMFETLINRIEIPCSSTVCLRRSMAEKIDTAEIGAENFLLDDLPFFLALSREGKFHAMREILAVYRVSLGSIGWPEQIEKKIKFEKSVCESVIFCAKKYAYGGTFFCRRVKNNCHDKSLKLLLGAGKYETAGKYLNGLSAREFWRWKIFRAWLAVKIPILRPVMFRSLSKTAAEGF